MTTEPTLPEIYEEVKKILNAPTYIVGGCVRDTLLGKKPKDYDFTTPITPDEIEKRVREAGRHPYITGKRFGTIGFKIFPKNPIYVEVTTFRTEKYEDGNRKPTVEYVQNIDHDLGRRDFTINAIAIRDEKIIDHHNGQEDLKNQIIRCVGNPTERFNEDPLRLLRTARFASQLGFKVDPKTQESATKRAHKILTVSKERWVSEMDKLLMTEHAEIGLQFLADTRILNFILPELAIQVGYNQNSKYHKHDLWTHTKLVVQKSPMVLELKWSALLHDIAKPFVRTTDLEPNGHGAFKQGFSHYIKHDLLGAEMVDKIALYLKWSNQRHKIVRETVLNHLQDDCPIRQADKEGH